MSASKSIYGTLLLLAVVGCSTTSDLVPDVTRDFAVLTVYFDC